MNKKKKYKLMFNKVVRYKNFSKNSTNFSSFICSYWLFCGGYRFFKFRILIHNKKLIFMDFTSLFDFIPFKLF